MEKSKYAVYNIDEVDDDSSPYTYEFGYGIVTCVDKMAEIIGCGEFEYLAVQNRFIELLEKLKKEL